MHRHAASAETGEDTACKLRGSCSVPFDTLAAVLSQNAVLLEPLAFAGIEQIRGTVIEPALNTLGRRSPPDSPPPRA